MFQSQNIKLIPKTNATVKNVTRILGHLIVLCSKTAGVLIQIYAYFIEMQGFVKPTVKA